MALKAIKGITVKIGGDTVGLQKALNEVDKSSKILNSELRQVNKALELDPTNTTLLAQKQQILSEQIRNTSLKLQQLKSVQEQVEQKYKKGDIGADAYRAFQRVLIETENRLESMKNEQEELNEVTEETEEETEEAEKKTKDYGKALEGLVNAAANAGQAILDAAKAAGEMALKGIQASTEVGKSFESSMSQIAATMGKTTDEITDLTEKAKEMGAVTQFSATEAAQGLNILAMSGLNTEEQIAGIEKVLNLAAAGSLSLESAASYTTGTVKGFGDTMENAQHYTDLMAKGATLANTNVNDLGAALSKTAANANSYGQTADGVTLSLLRLAEQNVTGENAATQLNRAMADLYTPTDAAKQALQELGIAAYDSQGNTRDFNVVVDELNARLSTMTAEQANAYKNTIFTTNGLNAFNKMTASSTEKVALFKEELANASEGEGAAAQQAKTMIDNLEGDIKLMQSAAEALGVTFYETFNDDLRESVQFATDGLSKLNEAFKSGGLEEAANVAGDFLADIANKAVEYVPQIVNASNTLINSLADSLAENAPSIAQSAKSIILALANGFLDNSQTILDAVIEIADGIIGELPGIIAILISRAGMLFTSILKFFQNGVRLITDNIPDIVESIIEAAAVELPAIVLSLSDLISEAISALVGLIPELLPTLVDFVTYLVDFLLPELLPEIINLTVYLVTSIIEYLPQLIGLITQALPILINSILNAVLSQLPTLLQGIFSIVNALLGALPQIITMLTQAIPPIITGIVGAVTANLPLIINTGVTLLTALIKDLPKIINSIVLQLPRIIDSIVSTLVDNISTIIDCGVELLLALIENLPEIIQAIKDAMPEIIAGIVTAITELFPVIVDLGKKLLMSLVGDLANTVTKIADRMPEIVNGITDRISEQFWKMVDVGSNLVSGIWEGITNAKDWLIDNIFGWCTSITDSIMNFFGIHSPSTLFRDVIGENLALGIGEGFSDTMNSVSKEMQNSIPTSFDIDPNIAVNSGDPRLQTVNPADINSGAGETITRNSGLNFTLMIENFNNNYGSSLDELSDYIEGRLYDFVYQKKVVF